MERREKTMVTISFGEDSPKPNPEHLKRQSMRLDVIDRGPYNPKKAEELKKKLAALKKKQR